jgi:hypothetical protein
VIKFLAAAALVVFAVPALAATQVYGTSSATLGNQNYGDNLGLDFTVNRAVKVDALGAFDSGADGISTNVEVALYNLDTASFVTSFVNFSGSMATGGSAFAFKAITPVVLAAGNYSIIGRGFNSVDTNFNTNISGQNNASPITFNSLSGALTNVGSRYGGGANPSAGTIFAPLSAFGAGSFSASVPEPATWGLMVAGFAMIGFATRRRSNAVVA